ncbi:MAG: UvrD-helicase domain-containing protein [Acidimicrobiales bacterium]
MSAEPANLVDQEVRDRIATDLSTRMAVDAGAGSGKTTSLVNRIVSLVASGEPVGSIAAITFTEAAAAELRTKVRRLLSERAHESDLVAVAARDVDDAAISTIHSFALRILRENWLEAGLPPAVELLDAAEEFVDHKTRWRRFTNGLLNDPSAEPVLVRGFASGLRMSQLATVASAASEHYDRFTPEVLDSMDTRRLGVGNFSIDLTELLARLDEAVAHLEHCTDDADHLFGHLRGPVAGARRRLQPLVGSDDHGVVLSVLQDLKSVSVGQRRGRAGNWVVAIDDVRTTCAEAQQALSAILEEARQSVIADLGWRIARWSLEAAAERRADGRLTFQDLLVEALRAVRDHAEVRNQVRSRYRCLLIDEFQDTDPLQAELAGLLGSLGAAGERGRLFVVGDPEQSIYRFRRADVAQFESTAGAMDIRLALTSNFRSVPPILYFVDQIFEGLTTDLAQAGGISHRSLVPTRPGLDDPADGLSVSTFGAASDEPAREVRLRSTRDVASAARAIADRGWTVVDDADGRARPARYRDIAVLLPTRTSLPMLERAFDRFDVPYRLEGAVLMWSSQDVRDVLAIARAASDPANPVAVVAALRTPALACGDDDLVRYRASAGAWDPRSLGPAAEPSSDPVERALRVIASLHADHRWLGPSALLLKIVTELRFFELALVHRRPRDHWHRLRWLIDQVRAFDEVKGGTLEGFLEWVDLSEEADRWSSSPGPPESDDDAVRVLTVHGAKGLEFPVVILTGLDTDPVSASPPLLFGDDGPEFSFNRDFRSSAYQGVVSTERALDATERLRLLYVALTRARDHLVVDLNHREGGRSHARTLHEICRERMPALARLDLAQEPEPRDAAADVSPEPASDWWAEQDVWIRDRRALIESGSRQPVWSATALAAVTSPGPPGGQGRATESVLGDDTQQRIGRAVHDALAKIDFPADGEMDEAGLAIARGSVEIQRLEGEPADRALGMVRSALASTLLRSIAAGRHWKELPLAAPLGTDGPSVIEGFADLVGESERGLVVVDFKTAPGRTGTPQYLRQVAIYAHLLRHTTGRPIERVVVSYLAAGGTEDVAAEGQELEELIQAAVRAPARPAESADAADAGQLSFFATV